MFTTILPLVVIELNPAVDVTMDFDFDFTFMCI